MSEGALHAAQKINLDRVLLNSLESFSNVSLLVSSFNARGGVGDIGNRRKKKYFFKIGETGDLRKELSEHKMTLNMALSLTNL